VPNFRSIHALFVSKEIEDEECDTTVAADIQTPPSIWQMVKLMPEPVERVTCDRNDTVEIETSCDPTGHKVLHIPGKTAFCPRILSERDIVLNNLHHSTLF
jgi:hypothetical protein